MSHAEFVTYFALKLTPIVGGDRLITVPTAILHDTGWNQMTQTELDLFYIKDTDPATKKQIYERYEAVLRARHQELGVELAKRLADDVDYPGPKSLSHVLEIISQHDTRKGLISKEENLLYPKFYSKPNTRYIENFFNLMLRLKGK